MSDRDQLEADVRARCDRGDHAGAATAIVKGYGPELTEYLSHLARGDALAEVFAVFCEDLWRGLPGFRFASSVRTWVYALARHAAFRHARGDRRRGKRIVLPGDLDDVAAAVRTATVEHLKTAARDRLTAARAGLDPEEREILALRVDQQLTWREIAEILGDGDLDDDALRRREQALRKRFETIKRHLKARMNDPG